VKIKLKELEKLIEKVSKQPIPFGEVPVQFWVTPDDFWDDYHTGDFGHYDPTLNPFYGGDIQRWAHAEGRHDYDRSECGRKSWRNRCKKTATDKMVAGYKKLLETPEGMAMHIEKSKKGAQAAKLVIANKICYNDKIYLGWKELQDQTGVSKYMFKKYKLGTIL